MVELDDLDDLREQYRSLRLDDEQPFDVWVEETLSEALADEEERKWNEAVAEVEGN